MKLVPVEQRSKIKRNVKTTELSKCRAVNIKNSKPKEKCEFSMSFTSWAEYPCSSVDFLAQDGPNNVNKVGLLKSSSILGPHVRELNLSEKKNLRGVTQCLVFN